MKKVEKYIYLVIILILIVIVACSITYAVTISNNDNNKNNNESSNEQIDDNESNNKNENNDNENIDDKKISEETINELFNSLITEDHTFGLYFNNKVTSRTANNENFIMFNLKNYLLENNIDYECHGICDEAYKETYRVNKDILNNYIREKYNTNMNYNLEISQDEYDGINFEGTLELFSEENNWVIVNLAKSGRETYIDHKLVRYEIEGSNLYLYTNLINCTSDGGSSTCHSVITDVFSDNQVINCSWDLEGNRVTECPLEGEFTLEDMANYALDNMSDELQTFKHTFIKENDNYYWYSTEIV